ncbi:MAG: SsrA-binding protein SmpB [Bdellovibrionales bacterium]|jgi:SsrA-binding protein|nr:SsrA-binding protein SmpB [Bdellovibrionales bacterium]
MGIKIIANNKRARYDYFLEETFEAGLVLRGTEIKSLRGGKVTLSESYVSIDKEGEVWIHGMRIPAYEFGNIHNHQEDRKRKLLLHKKEIELISHKMATKGLTLVPTKLYFKNSLVKIEIALAKGKKKYDKREDQAKKDVERKLRRGDFS